MSSKYEATAGGYVPAARSIIAHTLIEKYHKSEVEVAKHMGVAQAAVSKYMTGKYSEGLKRRMEELNAKIGENRQLFDFYIKNVASGDDEHANACVCALCGMANGFSCSFSRSLAAKAAQAGAK